MIYSIIIIVCILVGISVSGIGGGIIDGLILAGFICGIVGLIGMLL